LGKLHEAFEAIADLSNQDHMRFHSVSMIYSYSHQLETWSNVACCCC